jgi:hypothetical protein
LNFIRLLTISVGVCSKIKPKHLMASQPALDTLLTPGYLPTLLNKLLMTVRAANSLPAAADYSFHQMDEQFAGTLRRSESNIVAT